MTNPFRKIWTVEAMFFEWKLKTFVLTWNCEKRNNESKNLILLNCRPLFCAVNRPFRVLHGKSETLIWTLSYKKNVWFQFGFIKNKYKIEFFILHPRMVFWPFRINTLVWGGLLTAQCWFDLYCLACKSQKDRNTLFLWLYG